MEHAVGRNIKRYRELADFSQESFAEMLGVSRATLSAIENGHVTIDSTKLLTAARVLGRSVLDFFAEQSAAMPLLYRAVVDAAAPSKTRSEFERFCKAYRELEEITGVADSLLPPPEYSYFPSEHSRPNQFADQVASSERERMGLGGRDPIDNIFKLLEDQGVRVLRCPIEGADVYGISAYSREYGLCILINERNTLERQIFSVAHEFGHLLMHRSLYQTTSPSAALDKHSTVEVMASAFAATFLIPETGAREVFNKNVVQNKVGLEDIIFLKHYFRVSAEAMLRRLLDLTLLSEAAWTQLTAEINRRADPTAEFSPLRAGIIDEWRQVSRFDHLARKAALEEMVSLSKLAELLGTNVLEARKKVHEWRKGLAFAQA